MGSRKIILSLIFIIALFLFFALPAFCGQITAPQQSFEKVKERAFGETQKAPSQVMGEEDKEPVGAAPSPTIDKGPAAEPGFAWIKQTVTIEPGTVSKDLPSHRAKIENLLKDAKKNIEKINNELKKSGQVAQETQK